MRAGRLRHRVTLYRPGERTRAPGGTITEGEPVKVATVWARVEPLSGQERSAAMQTQADTTHEVEIRYRRDVLSTWHVEHDGRVLEIVSPPINPDGQRVATVIMCRERQEANP